MSEQRLSQQLMDAHMVGDLEKVASIKAEINSRYEGSLPKKKQSIIKVNTALNNEKSSAIVIYDFLNKSIGEDWWELEFETIEKLLWINYGTALEEVNRDKVWAIRHLCRSDNAFADWFEFNQCCLSFAGAIADFDHYRRPSAGMMINAVRTLNHIRPDREKLFSNDVLKYMCLNLKNDGIYVPPPSLRDLIGKKMSDYISKETVSKWTAIYKRYKEIVTKQSQPIEDKMEDNQAKRIIKAEAAANEYGAR